MNKYSSYLLMDSPIPYRGLNVHPVRMNNYQKFMFLASCLLMEKNSVPDVEIISMSYLKYIYHLSKGSSDTEISPLTMLDGLLRLVLKEPKAEILYGIDSEKGTGAFIDIGGNRYNSDDFEEIRNIICLQNELEMADETIQKSVRDEIKKAKRYKERMSGKGKIADLEEQIVALSLISGWDLETIYSLTIRKFIMAVRRADHIFHSKIYLQASVSGFVTFKDKSVVKHWLAEIPKDSDEGVIVELDSLRSKLSFENVGE